MDLKIVVSKEAHLLAELYELFHIYGDHKNPIYLFYHGETSKLLYYGSIIEKYDLWIDVFKLVIGLETSEKAYRIIRRINGIRVYKWNIISSRLRKHGDKLLEYYIQKRDKIRETLTRILGVKYFFNTLYVILAYNPLNELIGGLPYYDKENNYAIINLFIGPGISPIKSLDLLIHELIHGLIHINEIDIPEDIEEEFIDTLCPEGYLSRELGLTNKLNIENNRLAVIIGKYFDEKKPGITLIEYVKKYYSGGYLI